MMAKAMHVCGGDFLAVCGATGPDVATAPTLGTARVVCRSSAGALGVCAKCWELLDPDGVPAFCAKCLRLTTAGALEFGGVCDFCFAEDGGDDE